MFKNYL